MVEETPAVSEAPPVCFFLVYFLSYFIFILDFIHIMSTDQVSPFILYLQYHQ